MSGPHPATTQRHHAPAWASSQHAAVCGSSSSSSAGLSSTGHSSPCWSLRTPNLCSPSAVTSASGFTSRSSWSAATSTATAASTSSTECGAAPARGGEPDGSVQCLGSADDDRVQQRLFAAHAVRCRNAAQLLAEAIASSSSSSDCDRAEHEAACSSPTLPPAGWDDDLGSCGADIAQFCDSLLLLPARADSSDGGQKQEELEHWQERSLEPGHSSQQNWLAVDSVAAPAALPAMAPPSCSQQHSCCSGCDALSEELLEARFLAELAGAQLAVVAEERDLLAQQHQSLVNLMAALTMAAADDGARGEAGRGRATGG